MVPIKDKVEKVISLDTNILFFAFAIDREEHASAKRFLSSLDNVAGVVLSEFVLIELYRLLRNSVVLTRPLSAPEALDVIEKWRSNPNWQITGFPGESQKIHNDLWKMAGKSGFAVRRIFDARLALTLRHFGVTEFATANVKDFQDCGFKRVWNPLS